MGVVKVVLARRGFDLKDILFYSIMILMVSLLSLDIFVWSKIPNPEKEQRIMNYMDSLKDSNPYTAMQWGNANLPEDTVLMFYKETRMFYTDHTYLTLAPNKQAYVEYAVLNTTELLYNRLKEVGVTHIYINHWLDDVWQVVEGTEALMKDITMNHSMLIYVNGDHEFYELI